MDRFFPHLAGGNMFFWLFWLFARLAGANKKKRVFSIFFFRSKKCPKFDVSQGKDRFWVIFWTQNFDKSLSLWAKKIKTWKFLNVDPKNFWHQDFSVPEIFERSIFWIIFEKFSQTVGPQSPKIAKNGHFWQKSTM